VQAINSLTASQHCTSSGTGTQTGAPVASPLTFEAKSENEVLRTAVNNMASMEPPAVFAGRYLFTTEEAKQGGQALVFFARRTAGVRSYAIKYALFRTRFDPNQM
jgi:hypothetical protein